MKLKLLLLFLFISVVCSNALAKYEKSVVRISSNLSLYDYKEPWKKPKRKTIIGSGVIVENDYILTAAHVVSNAKTIEIRKSGKGKKYYAKVKYISYQADLALLEMYDKKFFQNTKALKISTKVDIEDKITIVGFPLSRKTLLSKEGVVSRLKYDSYSFSNEDLLSLKLKVDAKEGNSGGPILNKKEKIVGIAMQIPESSKNIAYAIPSSIIQTFFEDIKDLKVDGFHSNSNFYQYLENSTLQGFYKTNKKGMLVTNIDVQENQLKVDDIILKIEEYKVSDISKEEFFFQFFSKPVGKTISMEVFRNSKIVKIDYKLSYSKKLLQQEFETKPRYFNLAGLYFTPITRNYLQALGMNQYEMNMLFYEQKRSLEQQELVAWMETKIPHDINRGYNSKVEIVDKVNAIKVKSFEHFISLIKNTKERYLVVDFIKK